MRILWIGAGVMGGPMLGRLRAAGHDVVVSTRDDPERGARAAEAEAVFTMVGGPPEVAAVHAEVLPYLRPGALAVDMTTSSPRLARELAERAAARQVGMLDAPVSGGPVAAERGELSVMVGGEARTLAAAMPLLEALGTAIVHHGGPGAGQIAKLVNQVALAGAMLGLCEAFAFAGRLDAEPDRTVELLNAGILGSALTRLILPLVAAGDQRPGFRVRHMIKDLRLARAAAHECALSLDGLSTALARFEAVEARLGGDVGTQALAAVIEA